MALKLGGEEEPRWWKKLGVEVKMRRRGDFFPRFQSLGVSLVEYIRMAS
jgi:hypothetical protein